MPELHEAVKAVDDLNRAFEEFKSSHKENLEQRDVVIEEKLARIEESLDAAQKVADEAVLAAKRANRIVTDEQGNEIDLDQKAVEWARTAAKRRGDSAPADFDGAAMVAYKKHMNRYLRKGDERMGAEELKALSVGSDPDGGYTVHPDMSGRITERVFESSPMRSYASVQVISTDALEGMHDNDETGAGWVGETDSRPETDTPELGAWRIPVHEIYANPRATQKLLDDSEVNVEAWLAGKVASKFARVEAAAFVSGNGISKPRGFLTYPDYASAGVFEHGKIEQFDTGVAGGFAADPNGVDKLLDVQYGLKAPYRSGSNWFFNRSVTAAIRKMQDSDGNYIWIPGATAGMPAQLLGYPIAPFEDMPGMVDDALAVAFGNMREAYQIVDRMGVRTLRDPYTAKPHVQFYTTKRVGGDVVNFEALKLLKLAD